MSNHPMNTPTISNLSETLHTASPLSAYSILKVTVHFTGYFSRNSILNFQKFQNSDIFEICPLQKFFTLLLNVQSTIIFGVESQNTIINCISKTENDLKHSMFFAPP